jgi:hypothetical protein
MKLLARGQTTDSQQHKPAGSRCRQIRRRLEDSIARRFGPEAPWVQRHVAHCPRCQKRLAAIGKVDLALSIIKSQPHRLDLLTRANAAAVKMLKHSLREAAQAEKLEQAKSEPCLLERCARYRISVTNVAACVAILFLTKAGIFSSFDRLHTRGEAALKQYYSHQAGEDVAKDIFGA